MTAELNWWDALIRKVKIHGQRVELREIAYEVHQRLPSNSGVVVDCQPERQGFLDSFD